MFPQHFQPWKIIQSYKFYNKNFITLDIVINTFLDACGFQTHKYLCKFSVAEKGSPQTNKKNYFIFLSLNYKQNIASGLRILRSHFIPHFWRDDICCSKQGKPFENTMQYVHMECDNQQFRSTPTNSALLWNFKKEL